jgi:adenosine deaminase
MHVTINSDDPAYFGGYPLQKVFNWEWKIWETLCLNRIEASFYSEERKEEMKGTLKQVVNKHYAK